jgi:hypothetical protein
MAQKKYFTEEERKAALRAKYARYRSNPEVKAKRQARRKEQNANPEVKAKLISYYSTYDKSNQGIRRRIRHQWKRHGIKFASAFDREIWLALALYDGTVCAVTGMTNAEHIAKYGNRLSLDHDHQTGEPRRFLTDRTNVALGGLEALTPEQAQNLLRLHEEDRRSRNDNP